MQIKPTCAIARGNRTAQQLEISGHFNYGRDAVIVEIGLLYDIDPFFYYTFFAADRRYPLKMRNLACTHDLD